MSTPIPICSLCGASCMNEVVMRASATPGHPGHRLCVACHNRMRSHILRKGRVSCTECKWKNAYAVYTKPVTMKHEDDVQIKQEDNDETITKPTCTVMKVCINCMPSATKRTREYIHDIYNDRAFHPHRANHAVAAAPRVGGLTAHQIMYAKYANETKRVKVEA